MLGIPSVRNDWRLDAVSILAILGESNIKINAHLIAASWTCLLPRLIPAPQGLLAEERRDSLPVEQATVTGVLSGNSRSGLNYFPTLLHGAGGAPYTVEELTLEWRDDLNAQKPHSFEREANKRNLHIRPRKFCAHNLLAVASSLISLGLMIWSILIGDAVALLGILIMSLSTPILCIGAKWSVEDFTEHPADAVPAGDVVIRKPNGAFVVVHCDEVMARALYLAPNDRRFMIDAWMGRASGGVVGGLTLIVAIIMFGNCSWTMQAALAVTYTVLNVAYWSVTLVSPKQNWDLSQISLSPTTRRIETHARFTDALWRAIYLAGSADWARNSRAVPKNESWERWLRLADQQARDGNGTWDYRTALNEEFARARKEVEGQSESCNQAEQSVSRGRHACLSAEQVGAPVQKTEAPLS